MPPSKLPLLTLLKQARAFGLGVRARHAEPGGPRLQGPRQRGHVVHRPPADRARQGARDRGPARQRARRGGLDRAGFEALMSNLAQRVFLMRNVHDDAPVLFRTRWALSYLRGPLTLAEITAADAAGGGVRGRRAARIGRRPPAPRLRRRTPAAGTASAAVAARPRPSSSTASPSVSWRVRLAASRRSYRPHASVRACGRTTSTRRPASTRGRRPTTSRRCADGARLGAGRGAARDPGPEFADGARGRRRASPTLRPRHCRAREHKRWASALEDHVYRERRVRAAARARRSS